MKLRYKGMLFLGYFFSISAFGAQKLEMNSPVYSLAFIDDSLIAVGLKNGTIALMNSGSGEVIDKKDGHRAVISLSYSDGFLAAGFRDKRTIIWKEKPAQKIKGLLTIPKYFENFLTLPKQKDWVSGIAWHKNSGSNILFTGSVDGRVGRWAMPAGTKMAQEPRDHAHNYFLMSLDCENNKLVSGAYDGTVYVSTLNSNGAASGTKKMQHGGWVHSVVLSPDGKKVISAGGGTHIPGHIGPSLVKVWNTETGQEIVTPQPLNHERAVFALAFSPDGKTFASVDLLRNLKIWDSSNYKLIRQVKLQPHGDEGWPYALAYSPNGKKLAIGCLDQTVRMVNL